MRFAVGFTTFLGRGILTLILAHSGTAETANHNVAIIGAGAAGSSAAYHLNQYAAEAGVPINVTIFEKTDRIGGRTQTVNIYDDPSLPVELGASIFIELNYIMCNAVRDFNLSLREPGPDEDELLVIWDGERFVHQSNDNEWTWWKLTKLFWKYGLAPYNAQKLMKSTVARFLKLYEAPYFPFRSLTAAAYELDLTFITSVTGEQYLEQNKIGARFSHDIIQAATRVNYASNLANIHGLDAMVSIAPDGASQVVGGNWKIFDRMIKATKACVHFNTSVSKIEFEKGDTGVKRYAISTTSPKSVDQAGESEIPAPETQLFDKVILANPYQFSSIEVGDDVLQQTIDEIPYVKLHVTLFTSPFPISPGFFNLPPASTVPTTILTTLAEGDDASSGISGAGKAGFFSVSTLRTVTNPKTGNKEYLYKIFSPEKVKTKFLSSLLGVEVPDTFDSTNAHADRAPHTVEPVSWIHPHVFHSYPKAYPRVTFQDPIIGDGLYYTSGMESFISTMETSALMGKNVARLLVNDITGTSQPGSDRSGPTVNNESQAVLGSVDEL